MNETRSDANAAMSAPVRDLRAETRRRLASLAGADVVRMDDLFEWIDTLPAGKWLYVASLLGVRAHEGELTS